MAAFAVAIAVLAAVAAGSFESLRQARATMEVVSHTNATHTALGRFLAEATEIETDQRGFALTGDPHFLDRYEAASGAIDATTRRLAVLLADDTAQFRQLGVLLRELEVKREFSREVIRTRLEHGATEAANLVAGGVGKQSMDLIRRELDDLERWETALLSDAEARLYLRLERARMLSVAGFLFAAAISLLALLGMRRDIARREAAERLTVAAKEEAEAANRAKSEFLARMSHELRTPLNSIIGFSGVLLKNKGDHLQPRELTYLDRILSNGRHLLALINDVLDLSKIEARRMELETGPVMLDALIRDTVAECDARGADSTAVLRTDLPAVVAPVVTDAGKLKQVLINLVGNAMKFTAEGAVKVLLYVEPATGRPLRIDVIDTGPGIPPGRLEAIFMAFEQADRSVASSFGGTGLGLTISRALCTLMGYSLRVHSEVGRGTTFSILLDASAPLPTRGPGLLSADPAFAVAAGGASSVDPVDGRPTVLVIDDEADSRALLLDYLEEAGYAVLTAASATDGLRMMRECTPDAVTLDLLMHPQCGRTVLTAMQADPSTASIPVVVVSIVAEDSHPWAPNEVARIRKPVDREALLASIAAAGVPAPAGAAAVAA